MNASAPSQDGSRHIIWVSRVALIVGVVALLFVYPLGCSPRYYILLASIGVLPLLCGPAVYRWFGSAFVIAALAFALQQHRTGLAMKAQVQQMRADAQAQQSQSHTP